MRRAACMAACVLASLAICPAESPGAGFPLMSSCFEDAERLAEVTTADSVRVRYASVAGGNGSCYAVQVTKDGKALDGFLVGASLPVIRQFEKDVRSHVPLFPEPVAPPPSASLVATTAAKEAPPEPAGPKSLAGLRAPDIKGNPVDLNAMPATRLVVYFWSAADKKSIKAAEAMEHIHDQFSSPRKLEFVGIATANSFDQFQKVMSGSEATWPQILDHGKLADRYHVNPAKPIVILDRARNVITAVATPRDLVAELQRMGSK